MSSPGPAHAALVDGPLDVASLTSRVATPEHGAVVLFLGTVRNHQGGRAVTAITYTAYARLALPALERIVDELATATPGLQIAIEHRLGRLEVGEASVGIATSSPHRETAYAANRRALERLKTEVAIWKHEHYADGASAWREVEPLRG
jgi:molybdopterin synthase catalytic subunit